MADELAAVYVSIIPSAKGMAASLGKELGAPVAAASASASRTMQSTFASGGAKIAKGLKFALISGIAAGGLVTAGLLKVGSDFQNAFKTIRVGSGQTGKALQGLEGDFKTVLQQRPDNMQDVAKAVTDLNVRLGLTGPRLQEAAKQQLRLASITKTDLGANIETTSQLFTQYGIKASQQGAKLDELFRASQKTGVSVGDLAKGMISAGPVSRQLGLSYEESAGLLGVLGKAGIDAGAVMPALTKTIATAAKSGKNAGDVFRDTFDAIRKAPSDTAAAGAAIATFGARAGPKLAGLIRQGKLSYGELVGQIRDGKDTIAKAATDTATFSGKWKIFKNSVLVAIQPIATKFFNGLGNAMAWVAPRLTLLIGILQNKLPKAFAVLWRFIGPTVRAIRAFAVNAAGQLRNLVSMFASGGADAQGFAEILDNVFGNTGKLIPAFRRLYNIGLSVGRFIRDTLVPGFLSFARGAVTVGSAIGGFVKANWPEVLGAVGAVVISVLVPAAVAAAASFLSWAAAAIAAAVAQAAALAPIIAVGAAIALLGAGVVYAYQHFEVFRNVVDAVGRFLRDTVWPAIKVGAADVVIAFKGIVAGAQAAWRFLQPVFRAIGAYITGFVVPAFKVLWTIVQIYFAAIGAYISIWWNVIGHPIFTAVSAYIRNIVVPAFKFLWNIAVNVVFPAIAAAIRTWWSIASAVFRFVAPIVSGLIGTFIRMKDRVVGVFTTIKNAIRTAKNFISDRIGDIVGFITGLPGRLAGIGSGMFDFIKDAFRGAINFIIRGWNSLQFKIPGFDPPGPGPKFGGFTLGLPDIPLLKAHSGLVVPGRPGQEVPILALAGETVLPTHRRSAPTGADLQPAPRSSHDGPLIGEANFYDGVDMDLVFHKIGFEMAKAGR